MNRRTLLILLVTFVALVIITLIQSAPPAAPQTPDEPTPIILNTETFPYLRVYPDIAVSDIQAIRLRDPATNETFSISRTADGNWSSTDQAGQVDANAASVLEKTIVLLPYQRTLPITASTQMDEYGFQPNGQLFVEIVLNDNSGHVVAIGGLTTTGRNYYALVDERPEIYLLERGAVDYLIATYRNPPIS